MTRVGGSAVGRPPPAPFLAEDRPRGRYAAAVGRRQRRRQALAGAAEAPAPTTDYTSAEGDVLTLRDRLSEKTLARLADLERAPADSPEDVRQRRQELLFERLAVRWTVAGLPLDDQAELLGRYRMASADERRWIQATIAEHLRRLGLDLGPR